MKAVWLYAHGLSFRAIARFLNVSARSVFVWVKRFAENNYNKPVPTSDSAIVELDEMWHFIHSKKDQCGYGKPIAEQQNNLLTGNAEIEIVKPLQKCIKEYKNGM